MPDAGVRGRRAARSPAGRSGATAGGQVGGNPVAAMPAVVAAMNEVHEILR